MNLQELKQKSPAELLAYAEELEIEIVDQAGLEALLAAEPAPGEP